MSSLCPTRVSLCSTCEWFCWSSGLIEMRGLSILIVLRSMLRVSCCHAVGLRDDDRLSLWIVSSSSISKPAVAEDADAHACSDGRASDDEDQHSHAQRRGCILMTRALIIRCGIQKQLTQLLAGTHGAAMTVALVAAHAGRAVAEVPHAACRRVTYDTRCRRRAQHAARDALREIRRCAWT